MKEVAKGIEAWQVPSCQKLSNALQSKPALQLLATTEMVWEWVQEQIVQPLGSRLLNVESDWIHTMNMPPLHSCISDCCVINVDCL